MQLKPCSQGHDRRLTDRGRYQGIHDLVIGLICQDCRIGGSSFTYSASLIPFVLFIQINNIVAWHGNHRVKRHPAYICYSTGTPRAHTNKQYLCAVLIAYLYWNKPSKCYNSQISLYSSWSMYGIICLPCYLFSVNILFTEGWNWGRCFGIALKIW